MDLLELHFLSPICPEAALCEGQTAVLAEVLAAAEGRDRGPCVLVSDLPSEPPLSMCTVYLLSKRPCPASAVTPRSGRAPSLLTSP